MEELCEVRVPPILEGRNLNNGQGFCDYKRYFVAERAKAGLYIFLGRRPQGLYIFLGRRPQVLVVLEMSCEPYEGSD
ncbi:hypothetical protein MUK42_34427 [Musa troglodytarum]|uniref:Uncharacterized protein n=1 Tax=Musa troglodytarum TaxID=320322 RepID=A0A9E7HBE8_9LILI|nr:hypothetical protein MUK42_34427 [Musa troglodytarum]